MLRLLSATRMVVRYPSRLAKHHVPQPRPPRAEDGAPAPTCPAPYRQLRRCCGHLAERAHGIEGGAKCGFGALKGFDQYGGEEFEAEEAVGEAVDWGAEACMGRYELRRRVC